MFQVIFEGWATGIESLDPNLDKSTHSVLARGCKFSSRGFFFGLFTKMAKGLLWLRHPGMRAVSLMRPDLEDTSCHKFHRKRRGNLKCIASIEKGTELEILPAIYARGRRGTGIIAFGCLSLRNSWESSNHSLPTTCRISNGCRFASVRSGS